MELSAVPANNADNMSRACLLLLANDESVFLYI